MIIGSLLKSPFYIVAALLLFLLGSWCYDLLHRRFTLKQELVERDNLALALALGGYLLGLTLALGGVFSGPSRDLATDLLNIGLYGGLAIILLNLSVRLNDWLILTGLSLQKEVIQDQNCGVGLIEGANHIAMGLILFGVIAGEGGGIAVLLVFWALGQGTLILGARVYCWLTPYRLIQLVEKGNVAVGAACAGMLLAWGNIIRFAVQGTFISWKQSLTSFAVTAALGLLALPLVRLATDRFIFPGRCLTRELVGQKFPNIGAGVIEGVMYVAVSFLIGWGL